MKRVSLITILVAICLSISACGNNSALTVEISAPEDGAVLTTRSITFTAESAGDGATYVWNFGDGTAPERTSQPTIEHNFVDTGSYRITLQTMQGENESEPVSISINIENATPTASLFATPTEGAAPLQVVFSSAGSSDAEGAITEEYDFGDGSRGGPGATVRHTYHDPGSYTVTLIVRDEEGQAATDTVTISVGERPQARLWEIRMDATPEGRYIFDPPVLKIEPGDTIEWVNVNDSHSSTAYSTESGWDIQGIPSGGVSWDSRDSKTLNEYGERWSFTFPYDTPEGSYPYFCSYHEFAGQVGLIIVGEFSELDPAFKDSLTGLALERMEDHLMNLEKYLGVN